MGPHSIADVVPALFWEHPPGTPSLPGAAQSALLLGCFATARRLGQRSAHSRAIWRATYPPSSRTRDESVEDPALPSPPSGMRREAASRGPTHPSGGHATPSGCASGGDTCPEPQVRGTTPWHRAASRSGAEGPPATPSRPGTCALGRCVLPGGQVCVLPALCRTPSRCPSGRHTWAGSWPPSRVRVRSPAGLAGASPPKVPEGGSEADGAAVSRWPA
jgi:hypothetical protein